MTKEKNTTPVKRGLKKAPAAPKGTHTSFLSGVRQQAAKMHQQNIQMIESSNMSKAAKKIALKRLRDAYGR